jgi:hypothetical protein
MLRFIQVEDSIYRIILKQDDNDTKQNTVTAEFKYVTECEDPTCIYTRNKTKIREKFEEKIFDSCQKKRNLKILFYGSFLLYQELKIILLLADQISEIHFTDYAYKNILKNKNEQLIFAFDEFMQYIYKEKINVQVYIHTNPERICESHTLRRRFDVVCGIDIDYAKGVTNNRPIMRRIAEHALKIDGKMFLSQHNIDQLDLCCYKITAQGNIKLVRTEDYVKAEYYKKYWLQNLAKKLELGYGFIGIFCALLLVNKSPIISIATGTFCTVDIFGKYLLGINKINTFKREINFLPDLIKNELTN